MNKNIGERVKQIRGELNQRSFAEKLGVSLGSVSQIEQGKAMPSGDFLFKIHSVFGVDINWLFTGMNAKQPALNHREAALLDNYRHSSVEGQDAIERVALVTAQPHTLLDKTDKA